MATPLISYFYLRQLIPIKGTNQLGSHRFACIALEKIGEGYRVSAYLHNPRKGPFNAKCSVQVAVCMLNSENHNTILSEKELDECKANSVARFLFQSLHMSRPFNRYYNFYKEFNADYERNVRALNGALKEFDIQEPQKA